MPKTTEQVMSEFEARGETVRDWAEKRGYKPSLVYSVIRRARKGKRGKSHLIAVELGLKAAPEKAALL